MRDLSNGQRPASHSGLHANIGRPYKRGDGLTDQDATAVLSSSHVGMFCTSKGMYRASGILRQTERPSSLLVEGGPRMFSLYSVVA